MEQKNYKAFTLVELIVVITILAILGTIAFISLQGYSKSARDSVRISDVGNIKTSLELFHLNTGKYPYPDDYGTAKYLSDTLFYQGTFGDTVLQNVSKNMSALPLDPLTEQEYTYSISNNKNELEILTLLEGNGFALNSINQTNAAGITVTPKIKGNYNGIFIKTSTHIVPLPSIINTEVGNGVEIIIGEENVKSMVIDGGANIPEGQGNIISNTGSLEQLILTGSLIPPSDADDAAKALVIEIIKAAYIDEPALNTNSLYSNIINTTDTDILAGIFNTIVLGENTIVANDDGGGEPTFIVNQSPTAEVTFEAHTGATDILDGVTGYYIQNTTGLKWAAQDNGSYLQWSTNKSYTEPTWNGSSYDYPTGRTSGDYPAFAYCSGIGTGWRLPTKRELFSIITDIKPTGMNYYTALHSIDINGYWSSTVHEKYADYAWYGIFDNGYTNGTYKTNSNRVLCIHD